MINNVVLTGRLTRDPELRKTQSGTSVLSFTVAVNRKFDKDETDFINVVAWKHSAEFLSQHGSKGSLVGVEGRIQTRNYEDKDGKMVYVTEVVADNVQLLESKAKAEERRGQGGSNHYEEKEEEFGGQTIDIGADDLPF